MIRLNQKHAFLDVLLTAVCAAAMIAGGASGVFAQDATERLIEMLRTNGSLTPAQYDALRGSLPKEGAAGSDAVTRQLIDVLHANGTLSDAAYRELTGAPAAAPEVAAPVEAVAPKEEENAAKAEKKEEEEGYDVDVGSGGLVVETKDGRSSFELGGRVHVDAAFFDNDGQPDSGNATEVRRFRVELGGKINKVWEYGAAVDFGGGDVQLKSTYVSYVGFKPITITSGNWKEPFSMEELESSNYITFMERTSPNVLVPSRNPGIGAEAYSDHWTLGGGAFGEGFDDEHEDGVDESFGFVGRATVAPWNEKTRILHLGTATEYRIYDHDAEVSFDERWDVHLADDSLVDTGTLTDIDDIWRTNGEIAGVLGPFTAQAEWIGAQLDRRNAPDALLQGWYAYGAWTLTGESRIYKARRGCFDGIEPFHPVGSGGWGAWQVGLRYGVLDLSDEDIVGGEQDVLTVGLNWYALRNIRFMANWVKVLDLHRPGTDANNDNPSAFQVRSQVNW